MQVRSPMSDDARPIEPLSAPFRVSLTPPGSKSLTNRYLLLAALAQGQSILRRPLRADDTQVMVEALRALGVEIRAEEQGGQWEQLTIDGSAGNLRGGGALDLHNAGTAVRFLTAACTLADAPVIIDGNRRMRERPISQLVEILRGLGATIEFVHHDGRLPLRIHPTLWRGGEVEVGATLSSQFISALLMIAAPHAREPHAAHRRAAHVARLRGADARLHVRLRRDDRRHAEPRPHCRPPRPIRRSGDGD